MFGDVVGEPIGDFECLFRSVQVGGGDVFNEGGLHALLFQFGFTAPTEKIKHHAGSEDGAKGVGGALSGDVGGGAVDRLEKGGSPGVDVARGGETESAAELGGEVADDIAEEVVGDDDVELARVANELHGESVYIKVAGVDVGVFR